MTKLHFSEKVDRALEKAKDIIDRSEGKKDYFMSDFYELKTGLINLVDAIEQEKQPKEVFRADGASKDAQSSDVADINVAELKLPEVGKRYRDKETKEIMRVKGFTDQVHYSGEMMSNCTNRKDFWEFFEELPEDSIGKTPDYVKFTVGNQFVPMGEEQKEWVCLAGGGGGSKSKSIWKDVSELPEGEFQILAKLDNGEIVYAFSSNKSPIHQISRWVPVRSSEPDLGSYESGNKYLNGVKEWCYLTDYINNTEERLKKLEGK
jgi:hypothetical protein